MDGSLVTLSIDGSLLSVGDEENGRVRTLSAEAPRFQSLVEKKHLGGGKVAFRSLSMGRYLAVSENYLCFYPAIEQHLQSSSTNKAYAFELSPQPNGTFHLRLGDGRTAGSDIMVEGFPSGHPLEFTVKDARLLEDVAMDCCGPVDAEPGHSGAHKRWNDAQHQALAELAFAKLAQFAQEQNDPDLRRTADLWNDPALRTMIKQGLLRADSDPRYNYFLWSSHFFDPNTGDNYLHAPWAFPQTALSEGLKYAIKSAAALQSGASGAKREQAAFELGLAMHYMTDLSQPMHAANFPNSDADWRHGKFETFAAENKDYFDALEEPRKIAWEKVKPGAYGATMRDMLVELARRARRLFDKEVLPAIAHHDHYAAFTMGEIRGPVTSALTLGNEASVAFLVTWSKLNRVWTGPVGLPHHSGWCPNFFAVGDEAWAAVSDSDTFLLSDGSKKDFILELHRLDAQQAPIHITTESSREAPALAANGKTLLMTWKGNGNGSLNLYRANARSLSGSTKWRKEIMQGSNMKDSTMPAIVAHAGSFLIAWADHGTGLASDPGGEGIWAMALDSDGLRMRAPWKIAGRSTNRSPALAVIGDTFWMAWAGAQDEAIYWSTSKDGVTWSDQGKLDHSTNKGPGLAEMNGLAALFWRGSDNRIYYSTYDDRWAEQRQVPGSELWAHQDVRAANIGNKLYLGTNSDWFPRFVTTEAKIKS